MDQVQSEDFLLALELLKSGRPPSSDANARVLALLNYLQVVGGQVKDTDFNRRTQRHHIEALHYRRGMSAVYITINPSDTKNPLFLRYAIPSLGKKGRIELSPAQQAKLVASNPVAAAQFFHATMEAFITALLGYDNSCGVLGTAQDFYATVESAG